MILQSINPATDEIIYEYKEHQWEEVNSALDQAVEAQKAWMKVSAANRAAVLLNIAAILRERQEGLAFLISIEMGKVIGEAHAEIEKCAKVCEYYANQGYSFIQPKPVETDASESYVVYKPLGTVLAIMPWNFPFWQLFRCAAPALMAGNSVVLKHASNVSGCAMAIQDVINQAGIIPGLFKTLLLSSKKVDKLISDKRIKAISLTGSTATGKSVALQAAHYLKKCVLELGGSDPYIILADADLEQAVEACVKGRLINAGQSCIAAKRFIIEEPIYQRFEELFVAHMRNQKMGDPFDPATQYGPLARNNIREDLQRQVSNSISKGARLLLGGVIPEGPGAYYPATVLANVTPGMPAYNEELFGPVAALIKVRDAKEAIKVANDTSFGLGAAIFSTNIDRAKALAEDHLECGCCFINEFVRSDPRLPFGGIKESGIGRELSLYGLLEFVNIKTIYVK